MYGLSNTVKYEVSLFLTWHRRDGGP